MDHKQYIRDIIRGEALDVDEDIQPPVSRIEIGNQNIDFNSPTWIALKVIMEDELKLLRIKNDGNLSDIDTALTRGDIRRLKYLLNLPQTIKLRNIPTTL